MDIYKRMEELEITLPTAPQKGGLYNPCKKAGYSLYFLSGVGPNVGEKTYAGKLGDTYTLEEGQQFARNAALNMLAVLDRDLGDLNRIANITKLNVFVASTDDFYDQPQVANGASQLLIALFGEEAGTAARTAIGVNALPGNIPIEIEVIVEVK